MSGESLRYAAKHNDVATIRRLCLEKSNPCSADEFGLTALHYAVWNGHLECVKYLLMNPRGVTKNRERTTCINLQSSVGYTALHLAALECPPNAVREIATFLLLVGADIKLTDKNNRTAYNIAREKNNEAFLDVFRSYMDMVSGKIDPGPYKAMMTKVQKDYNMHPPKPVPIEREEGKQMIEAVRQYFTLNDELHEAIRLEKANGRVMNKHATELEREIDSAEALRPYFMSTTRVGETPAGLAVDEHLILPISEYGFIHQKDPILSIHTLRFADHQATFNAARRKRLMDAREIPYEVLESDYLF